MSHKYYYKSTPKNPHKIFQPNPMLDCPACVITPTNIITVYSFNDTVAKTIIKDAPLTFYKAPTNTNGGTTTTPTDTTNKYQIFINNMNKILFNNQVDSTNVNKYVTDVQNMINMLKTEDPNYLTNPYYIAMMLILRELDYEYRIKILEEDIYNMSVQLSIINKELNNYKLYCTCNGTSMFSPGEQHGIVANATISMVYIKYIELYGVPDDGIFLPSLLNQIQLDYNL